MRRLIHGVAVGFAAFSLVACGSAAPTVMPTPVQAQAPTATPDSTPAPTPTSSVAPVNSPVGASEFAGIWATPPLDWDDWQAAIEANGLDPDGAEDLIQAREDYDDYVQFEFEVRGAQWLLYQINDGLNMGVALSGQYSMSDTDTVVVDASEADCDVTLDLTGDEDELVVDIADTAGDACSENYDIRVQTAVYESAPFHLVEPSGGYVAPEPRDPAPQPSDPAATPIVSTSGDRYTLQPIGTVDEAALGYTEYLPPDYADDGTSPLLVFLHGSGESGSGDETSLRRLAAAGLPVMLAYNAWPDERPFVVLSPQHAEVHPAWCFTADEIRDFLAYAMDHYDVDPARIYLTGLSCGGIGLWNYLSQYSNDVVAAAVPIAGTGYAAVDLNGCDLGQLPIWAFHGGRDGNVPPRGSTFPLTYLQDCTDPVPADARLTLFPTAGHDVWSQTYNGSAGYDIYDWMLSHTK